MKYSITLGFIFIHFVIYSQQNLTLQEAIQTSLSKNYDVQIARTTQQVAENNLSWGNAGLLPRLTASAAQTFSVVDVKQKLLTGTENERNNAKSDNLVVGTSLVWTLFDGSQMFINYNILKQQKSLSLEETNASIISTVWQVSSAYYGIVQQNQKIKALEASLAVSQQRLNFARDRYEVGSGNKSDFLQARVDYNADSSAKLIQQLQLRANQINLNNLMGRSASENFSVDDTLVVAQNLLLDNLLEDAKQNNQTVRIAQAQRNIAYSTLRQVKAQRLPQLDLNVSYAYSKLNSQAGILVFSQNLGLTYGASAIFTIFDGFNQSRREQNAKLNWNISEQQIAQLNLQLEAEVTNAYQLYQTNLSIANLEKENLTYAEQNVAIALERYQNGVTTPLALREAQRAAIATQTRLIDALYNAKISELNLLQLSGKIAQK